MKTDWVVWLGCFLLFGAGAVWAEVPIPTSFFKVADVHDLFEILSSLATVVAVVIAASSINVWRHQLRGDADNSLARRLLVVLAAYKGAAVEAWGDATFAINEVIKANPNQLAPQLYGKFAERFRSQLLFRERKRDEFVAVLLEVKAVWGEQYSKPFDGLLNFVGMCNSCVMAYVEQIDGSTDGKFIERLVNIGTIHKCREYFVEHGWVGIEGEAQERLALLTVLAEKKIEEKLL